MPTTPEPAPLIVRLEPGIPRTGIWCDGCLTSARVEFDVLTLGAEGVSVVGTSRRCRRCDEGREPDADDQP